VPMRSEIRPDRFGEEVAYEAMTTAFWRQVESRALRWLTPDDVALYGAGLAKGINRFRRLLGDELRVLAIEVEYVRAGDLAPSERWLIEMRNTWREHGGTGDDGPAPEEEVA
jgi:hypothetical protein